jgi:hypothetical protein
MNYVHAILRAWLLLVRKRQFYDRLDEAGVDQELSSAETHRR